MKVTQFERRDPRIGSVNMDYQAYEDMCVELESRADEIGKPLEGALRSCKELKYRKHGIRLIFRVSGSVVELVEITVSGFRWL